MEGALYTSCANAASNTEVQCFDWSPSLSGGELVTGLTEGATYLLEVEAYNNDWTGTYTISIQDLAPVISANTQYCLDLSDAANLNDVGNAGEPFNCSMFSPEFTSS